MDYEMMDDDELGSWYSDYHKDTYGFRPRGSFDRHALIDGLVRLDNYHAMMRSTKEGRNELRDMGWVIGTESDGLPTAEQDGWNDTSGFEEAEYYAELNRGYNQDRI